MGSVRSLKYGNEMLHVSCLAASITQVHSGHHAQHLAGAQDDARESLE